MSVKCSFIFLGILAGTMCVRREHQILFKKTKKLLTWLEIVNGHAKNF